MRLERLLIRVSHETICRFAYSKDGRDELFFSHLPEHLKHRRPRGHRRQNRPAAADKSHLDEVVVPINSVKHWLWWAVDANGDVLDILVQKHRNAKAAKRFLRRLIDQFGTPRVVITDKLRSYINPINTLMPNADHRAHNGLNNRIDRLESAKN